MWYLVVGLALVIVVLVLVFYFKSREFKKEISVIRDKTKNECEDLFAEERLEFANIKGQLENSVSGLEQKIKDALQSHEHGKLSLAGKIKGELEKYLPFFSGYFYDLRDVIPVFKTIDYFVFARREDFVGVGKIEDVIVKEIVFQEVKTGRGGTSDITPRQNSIRECIENGNIRFEAWIWNEEQACFICKEKIGHRWKEKRQEE
jgi:predicted Holliday junction resolvase-like endonuclease